MLSFITSEYLPPSALVLLLLFSYISYYTGWIIYSRFFHPYHDIPGPFLASISTWWRWYAVRYSVADSLQHALHDKYGPIVRIGPNEISVSDPHAIDLLSKPEFPKTEFYSTFNPGIGGRIEPFAEQDDRIHTQHKRIITPLFRSEVVLEWESYINRILGIFDERMAFFAKSKTPFDLADYVARYAWDTVGDMVYSRNGGFGMLKGDDYMGWMEMIRVMPGPMASLGYVPHGLKNLYFISMLIFSPATRRGLMSAMTIVKQVKQLVQERKDLEAKGEEFPQTDMLSRMMAMTRDEKVDFNEDDIGIILNAFVWAGSDTTGSSLAMIMYFILTTPQTLPRLLTELHTAFPTTPPNELPYSSLSKLPYLTACINEGLRLHFIIGVGLPRYIAPSGARICGRDIPGGKGLKVVVNMAVMQTEEEVFGTDTRTFRAERWMGENTEVGGMGMVRGFHPWGIGTRICQGRFIAMMEMYKFVASTLLQWDFEVVENEETFGGKVRVTRGYMQQPEGPMVRVKKRNGEK